MKVLYFPTLKIVGANSIVNVDQFCVVFINPMAMLIKGILFRVNVTFRPIYLFVPIQKLSLKCLKRSSLFRLRHLTLLRLSVRRQMKQHQQRGTRMM